MNVEAERTRSLWMEVPAPRLGVLPEDADADVLVIGAGIMGLTTAYELARRGRQVMVLDRGRFGRGMTARTTAHLAFELDDFFHDVGFIGKSPDHELVYVATGDSGQGMTTGGAAALVLADLMNGRENPWASLYSPSRQMHRGLGEYVKENLEAARHWLELVGRGETASAAQIAPGDGAVIKVAGKPVAVHRDETGGLHARSAICTHAGCMVHWNGFEGCWDCPCHGSQFAPDGQVLNGPAVQPLGEAASAEEDRKPRPDASERDAASSGDFARPKHG